MAQSNFLDMTITIFYRELLVCSVFPSSTFEYLAREG
jgi:hypothetical protein